MTECCHNYLHRHCPSVRSGKTAANVFKSGGESPWDTILNEPVPRLIRMFVYDWAKKSVCAQSVASIYLAAFVIFLYEGWQGLLKCRWPLRLAKRCLNRTVLIHWPAHKILPSIAALWFYPVQPPSVVLFFSCHLHMWRQLHFPTNKIQPLDSREPLPRVVVYIFLGRVGLILLPENDKERRRREN